MEELFLRHFGIAVLGVIGSFFDTLVGGSGLLILPALIHLPQKDGETTDPLRRYMSLIKSL